jgi:hypothetical protein
MLSCANTDMRNQLISAGRIRLAEISLQRNEAELELSKVLEKFATRRECWA